MDLKELTKEIQYKWRVQSYSKYKPQATCVAYIEARDCMDILDDVCGPENWQVRYVETKGLLFAEVGIKIFNPDQGIDEWVWKSDTGSESNMEPDKGHVSDAFKRACVHWGIGRFLYRLKVRYVDTNEKKTQSNYPYPIDSNNQRIYDLTEYFDSFDKLGSVGHSTKKPKLTEVQYGAMMGELSTGKYEEVEKRMYNYTLTSSQESNLLESIAEVKKLKNI